MYAWYGNVTAGFASYTAPILGLKLLSFSLVEKAGASTTVTVTIDGIAIVKNDLAIGADELYESSRIICIPSGQEIIITTAGNLDYYFSFENFEV